VLKILDLFLLALIAEKIDTPYRWQRQAAVSTGASLPSIRRLASLGLVREAEPGPRGRRRFNLTRAGRIELNKIAEYVEAALQKDLLDMESLLRLVSMAHANGRHDLVTALLKKAASYRNKVIGHWSKCLPDPLPKSLADSYSAILALYERDRQQAAIHCINSLLLASGTKLPAKTTSAILPKLRRK